MVFWSSISIPAEEGSGKKVTGYRKEISSPQLRAMTSEQHGTYNVQSPTHSHYSYPRSPKNLSARQSSLSNPSTLPHPSGFGSSMVLSQPTSPTAPSLPPMNAAKHTTDGSINNYYGPTRDRDDRLTGRNGIHRYEPYQSHQVSMNRFIALLILCRGVHA